MKAPAAAVCALGALLIAAGAMGQDPVPLPAPRTEGGKPLMQALKARATSRSFASDPVSNQTLSDLLWAAWGVNRPGEGKRTAPSARDWQEIDLFVLTAQGAFLYDATRNLLVPKAPGDLRALGGTQEFVKQAPVTVVLVADTARMKGAGKDPDAIHWAWADAGFICQNIYLYCASEGLATGTRAFIDRPAFAKAFGLSDKQVVLLAQSVGYPKR